MEIGIVSRTRLNEDNFYLGLNFDCPTSRYIPTTFVGTLEVTGFLIFVSSSDPDEIGIISRTRPLGSWFWRKIL